MSKNHDGYDGHIVKALTKINWPLINFEDIRVRVRERARNETGYEHIAAKKHLLKVRDIEQLPDILKHPYKVRTDLRNGNRYYYGIRKGKEKSKYLKIVVTLEKDQNEKILSLYPVKCVDRKKMAKTKNKWDNKIVKGGKLAYDHGASRKGWLYQSDSGTAILIDKQTSRKRCFIFENPTIRTIRFIAFIYLNLP